ncbi:hypothetical protein AVEN_74539-1 [Araneus ventricosus]|uniref:Uncharacterized protein n=1 Tax=Araneus ventricosus TaxID=182803 RepID=A0A4Y2GPQ7_ARAVE|nr:hypothetical protein AVEN_74539-1 [Araneus ventricosus]
MFAIAAGCGCLPERSGPLDRKILGSGPDSTKDSSCMFACLSSNLPSRIKRPPASVVWKSLERSVCSGIRKEYFFDGQPMETTICIPFGALQDPFEGSAHMVRAYGETSGQCEKDHGVVQMIVTVREKRLDGFILTCRRLKKDAIEKNIYENEATPKEALCKEGDVIAGLEVQLEEPQHLLKLICQKLKSASNGANGFG